MRDSFEFRIKAAEGCADRVETEDRLFFLYFQSDESFCLLCTSLWHGSDTRTDAD